MLVTGLLVPVVAAEPLVKLEEEKPVPDPGAAPEPSEGGGVGWPSPTSSASGGGVWCGKRTRVAGGVVIVARERQEKHRKRG